VHRTCKLHFLTRLVHFGPLGSSCHSRGILGFAHFEHFLLALGTWDLGVVGLCYQLDGSRGDLLVDRLARGCDRSC
jgi:hypothetical protein